MNINKWFNKQKPITLGFISAVTGFIICYIMSYFTEVVFEQIAVIKFCGAISLLMFFMSWLLFSMGEKSSIIFDEINSLFISAKKVKTKEQLETVEDTYKILRRRCQHQNHYSKMNEIWQIIQTKKEYIEL